MPYSDPSAQRAYQNEWKTQRRSEWFTENGPCVDCGTWEELQLDHRDAKTKVSHRVWSWSAARRAAELTKCVARCRGCHVAKTLANDEHARGTACTQAKLSPGAVVDIKRRNENGESKRSIARLYGVDEKAVRLAIAGETWRIGRVR